MTTSEPGNIVLVRFPFTDLTSTKQRPALIISPREYSLLHGDVVLMPLTSQPQNDPLLALVRWRDAGLPKPTWIKPVIGKMSHSLIVRLIGQLGNEDVAPARQALKRALDKQFG
jgi:mRNA interferase MazF